MKVNPNVLYPNPSFYGMPITEDHIGECWLEMWGRVVGRWVIDMGEDDSINWLMNQADILIVSLME